MKRQDLKIVKNCSVEQLLHLVNAVVSEEEQIRPVGSRLYETTIKATGVKIRGSLTCVLFIRLYVEFLKENKIDFTKFDKSVAWDRMQWKE